eukprot:GFKZ01014134.1.p1 GENE.GFKZ01014134.1~~GFKZ01014134.1.p1  ORF type:complete len:513 (+),score=20.53 GFKZ01014134.1:88-1626(+)
MAVTLADIPPDIWSHIASYLTILDLKRLSLTSIAINRLITSDCVFRQIYLTRSTTPPANTSWQNLYRRLYAITHCPSYIPTPLHDCSSPFRIVASIGDILVASHGHTLTAYPTGWAIDVRPFCGERDILLCSVPMPAELGILHDLEGQWCPETSQRMAEFTTLSLNTGTPAHSMQIPVGTQGITVLDCPVQPVNPLRAIFLGGQGAQFLVYFIEQGQQLLVVERTTGACISRFDLKIPPQRNVRLGNPFGRLVRGDAGYIEGGFLVVGVIEESREAPREANQVILRILGGGREKINLEKNAELIDVVRSRDGALAWRARGRDGITIWRTRSWNHDRKWPMRICGADATTLLHASTEFSISEDGCIVFLMPKGLEQVNSVRVEGRVLRLVFMADILISTECLSGRILPWQERWSWAGACAGGRVVIAAIFRSGVFAAFDLAEGSRLWSLKCGDAVSHAAIVGEHYLVAIGRGGRSYVWHFDKFCSQRNRGCLSVGDCVPIHISTPHSSPLSLA